MALLAGFESTPGRLSGATIGSHGRHPPHAGEHHRPALGAIYPGHLGNHLVNGGRKAPGPGLLFGRDTAWRHYIQCLIGETTYKQPASIAWFWWKAAHLQAAALAQHLHQGFMAAGADVLA